MKSEIKGNVLLYDTDPKNQEELRSLLENEGLHVTTVNSIEEIVEEVWKNRPLGILLSVYDESEYQRALEICQMLYEYKDVPIVIINRFSMDFHHTVDALSAGAFEHFLSHTSNDNAVKRFIKVVEETSQNRPQTAQPQVQKPEDMQKTVESAATQEPKMDIETDAIKGAFPDTQTETSIPAAAPPTGKLEDISISELVEIFRNQIFDGRVVIRSDAGGAELEFRNGELQAVKTGKKKDIRALREINNWKSGDFWIYYRANPFSPLSAERFNMLLETGVPLEFLESQFPTIETSSSQETIFEGSQPEGLQGLMAEQAEEVQQPTVEEAQPEELEALLSQMEQQAEQQLESAQRPETPPQAIFEEAQPEELQGIIAEQPEEVQQPQQPAVEEAQPEELEALLSQMEQQAEQQLESAQRPETPPQALFEEAQPEELQGIIAKQPAEVQQPQQPTVEEAQPEELEALLSQMEQQAEQQLESAQRPETPPQAIFEEAQPEELQGIIAEQPEEVQQPTVEEAQPEELEALLSQMEQQAEQQLESAQRPETPPQAIFEEAQPEELQGIMAEQPEEVQQPTVEEAQPEELEALLSQMEQQAEQQLESAQRPETPPQAIFEEAQPEELQGIMAEQPEEAQQPTVEEAQPEELEALLSQMEQQAEQQLESAQRPETPPQALFEEAQPEELQGIIAEQPAEAQQPTVEEAQPEEVQPLTVEEAHPEEAEKEVLQIFAEEAELEETRGAEAEMEVPVAEKPETDLEKLIQAADVAEHKLKEKITAEGTELAEERPSEIWESLPEKIHNKLKETAFQFPSLYFVCLIDPLNRRWTYYRLENENPEEVRDIFVNLIQNSETLFGESLDEAMGQSEHFIYLISSLKNGTYYLGAKVVRGDSPLGAIRLIAREIRKNLEEIL